MRKITLHKDESPDGGQLHLVRLAGSGAGEATEGESCTLAQRTTGREFTGHVLASEVKKLRELEQSDAERLLYPPDNGLRHLRQALYDRYRFRPQWEAEETRLKLLTISVDEKAPGP